MGGFYRDIVNGMALNTGSALQRDLVATLARHDEPALGEALNKKQIASKMGLADSLLDAVGPELGNVLVLGGWLGVLGAVLLHDPRFVIDHVESVDIDPRCAAVALSLNASLPASASFGATSASI